MTDFARLALEIDSRQVKEGVGELDKLTSAGQRTSAATDNLASTSMKAATVLAKYREMVAAGTIEQGNFSRGIAQAKAELLGLSAQFNASTTAMRAHSQAQQAATVSAGAQRAGMQQLSYQIGDVAQQFALGVNPMVIFAQQGGQVVQALTLMRGSAGGLASFLGGPWGAAIMGGVTVLGMMIPKLLETSSGMDQVKFASHAMGDAQGILGKVMDMTTGKINTQNGALIALARAQLLVARVQAQTRAAEARSAVADIQSRPLEFLGNGFGGGIGLQRRQVDARDTISQQVLSGAIDGNTAIQRLENLRKVGVLTDEQFSNAAASVANLGVELENLKVFDNATKLLNGESVPGGGGLLKAVKASSRKAGQEGGKAAADEWGKLLIEGLGKFDPEIQKRMQGIFGQTASDLADMRSVSVDAFDHVYKGLNRAADANMAWNDQLAQTAYLFDQIGGAGRGVADILNILGGNYGAVNGPLGVLVSSLAGISWTTPSADGGRPVIRLLGEEFNNALNKVFGNNGTFTKLLQGGQVGMSMGAVLFGNNQGAQIGGMIGGSLGSLLGPVGNIVGSIIGSTLGKLLGGGAKYGSAVVGPNGVVVGGNNDNSKGAATGAGGAVSSAIEQIAQALGGTVGNYAVSIGETDGKWRISTTGRSGELKSKYSDVQVFGKGDAAAEQALKAAIADAIKDGAIQGVSAAVGRLLQGGGDIDKQVQKAQLFQGVFSELKAQTDPLGAALDGVAKQFDALRKIFDEAGASTEEYASLEQLLGIKRQEAIDAARQANVDKISDQFTLQIRALELLGKGEAALAASRLLELAGMKDTLKPIQEMIYQLEDAQAVMSQFKPLADDLRAYRKELVGTSSVASYGAARALFASTAASAAMGDAAALGNLRGVSDSYLASAKATARSGLDYNRARGQVLAAVDQGIFAADTKVDYAQATIDAIDNSAQIMQSMREELRTLGEQTAANTSFTANLLRRLEGPDGLQVSNTNGTPLQVEIVT